MDQSQLIQTVFNVRRKNGMVKRMNMQLCQCCGRRYINISVLPDSLYLEKFELTLTAIDPKQWEINDNAEID